MSTINVKYAGSAGVVLGVSSLASSSTFTSGRESTVIDNSSNLFDDILIRGKIKTTAQTSGTQILIQAYSIIDDTPSYPDAFTGTDANVTLTTAGIGAGFLKTAAVLPNDSTSARTFDFAFPVAPLFGGVLPNKFGLYVSHNTGGALDGTAANHFFNMLGVTFTVA